MFFCYNYKIYCIFIYFIKFVLIKSYDYNDRCLQVLDSNDKIGFSSSKFLTFDQAEFMVEVKIFETSSDIVIRKTIFNAILVKENCDGSTLTIPRLLSNKSEKYELQIILFFDDKIYSFEIFKAYFYSLNVNTSVELEGLYQMYKIKLYFSAIENRLISYKQYTNIVWSNKIIIRPEQGFTSCITLFRRGRAVELRLEEIKKNIIFDRLIVTIFLYGNQSAKYPQNIERYIAKAYSCHESNTAKFGIITHPSISVIIINIKDEINGREIISYHLKQAASNADIVWRVQGTQKVINLKVLSLTVEKLFQDSSFLIIYPHNVFNYGCPTLDEISFIKVYEYLGATYYLEGYVGDYNHINNGIATMRRANRKEEIECNSTKSIINRF